MSQIEARPLLYLVVKNAEEQHSIWPSDLAVPAGWEVIGAPDTRERCLAWIEEHWTDIRPLSTRRHGAPELV